LLKISSLPSYPRRRRKRNEQTERSIDKVMNKQYLMQNFTKYHRLAQKLRGNSYKDNVNSLSVSLILTQVMSITLTACF
jgi:hypothetical protein